MPDEQSGNRKDLEGCVERALLGLMLEKPFAGISVVQIVKKSGVSRDFFYRHFKTKMAVAEHCVAEIFMGMEPLKMPDRITMKCLERDLVHLLVHKDILLLFHKNGLSGLMWPLIKERFALPVVGKKITFQEEYDAVVSVSAFYELIKLWLDYGMVQTPKYLMGIMVPKRMKSS